MSAVSAWVHRRKLTIGLTAFLVCWYGLELLVVDQFGEETAVWWFYLAKPESFTWEGMRGLVTPGMVLAVVSHDLETLTHIGANVLFLLVVGGFAEPYIGRNKVFALVIGVGLVSIWLTNLTALVHHLWIFAGASGGVLALWGYVGVRQRGELVEYLSEGLRLSRDGVERVVGVSLVIGIPVVVVHQLFLVEPAHVGHVMGMVLGCVYRVCAEIIE